MKKQLLGSILGSLPTLLWLLLIFTRPEMNQPDEPETTTNDLLLGLLFVLGPIVLALLGAVLTNIKAKSALHKTGRVLLLMSLIISTLVSLIFTVGNTPVLTTWLILSLVALAAGIYGLVLLKEDKK